jgi:transposase-like protein
MKKKNKERRVYTNEFKTEAISLAEKKKKPINQIALDFGISSSMLYRWTKQSHETVETNITTTSFNEKIQDIEPVGLSKEQYIQPRVDKPKKNKWRVGSTIIIVLEYLLLITIFIIIKYDWGAKIFDVLSKQKESITTEIQSAFYKITGQLEPVVVNKEYRLVTHITNDLSPILKQVAEMLEYNDIEGIKNWIYADDISDSRLGFEIKQMRNIKTVNDQNGDGKINCMDFAILFYKLATDAGYDVKIMTNKQLIHAFNAIRRDNGTYETIEPQSGKGGRIIMRNAWKDYNPEYDIDSTVKYRMLFMAKEDG